MTQIVLEVIKMAARADGLFLVTQYENLLSGQDPVELLSASQPDALTHSTSWRWADNQLFLTFVQVFPDNHEFLEYTDLQGSDFHDPDSLPKIECHAVRHLYFLLHTDEEFSVASDLELFWKFAHSVVEIHQPAVAGFVGLNSH